MKSKKEYKKPNQKPLIEEEPEEEPLMAEEPLVEYRSQQRPIVKGFEFSDFKTIAAKVDFTQKEWSDLLHISERTLQRYAHNDGSFNTGIIDRILQINKVFNRGREVFGSYEKFNLWLRGDPYMLEGRLSIYSLASFEGINNIFTQVGRIEHGILA